MFNIFREAMKRRKPEELPAAANLLDVQRGAKHGDRKMCQHRRVVIELNPANHAVVFEILRNFGFVDFEMFG